MDSEGPRLRGRSGSPDQPPLTTLLLQLVDRACALLVAGLTHSDPE